MKPENALEKTRVWWHQKIYLKNTSKSPKSSRKKTADTACVILESSRENMSKARV